MPRPLYDIGAAVYAALTDAEKQRLSRSIVTARISYAGPQSDDWLCCILQHRVEPRGYGKRRREVTEDDLRGTCVDLVSLMDAPDWPRVLSAFGSYRDRVNGLYEAAARADAPRPDYDAIGRRVYEALTPQDRRRMRTALRICRDDPDGDDDWHCALGNRGYGNPIEEGVRVTNEHVLEMCSVLAKLHDVVRDDPRLHYESGWRRLIGGAVGYAHAERVQGLFAEARMPLFEPRTEERPAYVA